MKKVIAMLLFLTVTGLPVFAAGKRPQKKAADTVAVSRQVYQARVNHLNARMEQAWNSFQERVHRKKYNQKDFQQKLDVLMDAYHCLGLYGDLEDIEFWTKTLRTPIQTGKRKTFDLVAFLEKNAPENDLEAAFFVHLLKLDDLSHSKPLFLDWLHAPVKGLGPDAFADEE